VAVRRYLDDRAAILRRYEVQYSPARHDRLRRFQSDWSTRLGALDMGGLNHEGQVDYILLRNRIAYDREMLQLDERRWQEIAPFVPFAGALRALQEDRTIAAAQIRVRSPAP
jgi:hypothetical protein